MHSSCKTWFEKKAEDDEIKEKARKKLEEEEAKKDHDHFPNPDDEPDDGTWTKAYKPDDNVYDRTHP